jgi:hypothetical protein
MKGYYVSLGRGFVLHWSESRWFVDFNNAGNTIRRSNPYRFRRLAWWRGFIWVYFGW